MSKEYVDKMVSKFSLDENSSVLEVASNDGYLLNFVKKLKRKSHLSRINKPDLRYHCGVRLATFRTGRYPTRKHAF